MYERFTDTARRTMQLANQEAMRLEDEYIGTEHILLGLIREGSGVAFCVLKDRGAYLDRIRKEVDNLRAVEPCKLPQMPGAKETIIYAMEEARRLNSYYVAAVHILLGLLRDSESTATRILRNLGLEPDDIREELLRLLGHDEDDEVSEVPDDALDRGLATSPHGTTQQEPEQFDLPAICTKCGGDRVVRILWAHIHLTIKDKQDIETGRAIVPHRKQGDGPSWVCLDCSSDWAEVHRLSLQIDELQQVKEEAIGSGEFEKAVQIRDTQMNMRQQMMTLVEKLAGG